MHALTRAAPPPLPPLAPRTGSSRRAWLGRGPGPAWSCTGGWVGGGWRSRGLGVFQAHRRRMHAAAQWPTLRRASPSSRCPPTRGAAHPSALSPLSSCSEARWGSRPCAAACAAAACTRGWTGGWVRCRGGGAGQHLQQLPSPPARALPPGWLCAGREGWGSEPAPPAPPPGPALCMGWAGGRAGGGSACPPRLPPTNCCFSRS